MNYTKGPWRKIAGDVQGMSIDGEYDLTIATGLSDDDDASLIIAAPDMYEALKVVVRAYGSAELIHNAQEIALEMAEAALAKAEGSEDERNYTK